MTADQPLDVALDELVEAYTEMLAAGHAPSVDSFAGAHPEHADALRTMLPVLCKIHSAGEQSSEQARTSHASSDAPTRVGPYTIEHPLGRGGMGRVFAARDPNGVRVALKLVHPHLVGDESFLQRFLREAEIGRGVTHANVVQTIDSGGSAQSEDDPPYIVMEFVEGQNLRELSQEVGRVPERLVRNVAVALADALDAVHLAGILHRDIKPENVIITAGEQVKLMDLGVARLMEERERLSGTGDFVGSLLYAAPEQLTGAPLDARSDLFALGLVLFELVVGRHLRDAMRQAASSDGRLSSVIPASGFGADVSPFFDLVVSTLLAPSPDDRFLSAAEVGRVLRDGERSTWWRTRKQRDARAASSRLNAAFAVSAFHGRESELDILTQAFAQASRARGQVVLLEGDAGLGKSRLIAQWLDAIESDELAEHVIVATHGPGSSEHPISPMTAALFEAWDAERLGDLDERVTTMATWAGPALEQMRGSTGARAVSHFTIGAAYALALRVIAEDGLVLLVAEDLHLASEQTRAMVAAVARSIADRSILLVASARPTSPAPWPADLPDAEHATHVRLGPLDAPACTRLLLEVVDGEASESGPLRELARRSDGNPLFLIELARTANVATGPLATAPIPGSIREIVTGRLAALDAASRELLEPAACFGHVFDPTVVADAAGTTVLDALKRLARIERSSGLVVTQGMDYRFQHHVVRDALYEGLHARLRAAYHTAIGTSLEKGVTSTTETPTPALSVTLTRQFLQSEFPRRALPYLRRAIDHLIARNERDACAALCHAALAVEGLLDTRERAYVLSRSAQSRAHVTRPGIYVPLLEESLQLARASEDHVLAADVLRDLGQARVPAGDYDGAIALLKESLALCERGGAVEQEILTSLCLGGVYASLSRFVEAREPLTRALALSRAHENQFRIEEATRRMSHLATSSSDSEQARAYLEESLDAARTSGDREAEAAAYAELGRIDALDGRYGPAIESLARGLDIYLEAGRGRSIVVWSHMLSATLADMGHFDRADFVARRGMRWGERFGDREAVAFNQKNVAVTLSARGRMDEARRVFEAALAIGADVANPTLLFLVRAHLFDHALDHGDLELAGICCAALRELSDRLQDSGQHLSVLLQEAALAESKGDMLRAHERFDHLVASHVTRDSPTGDGHPTLGFARTSFALGRADEGREAALRAAQWGRASSAPGVEVLARVLLARHADGNALAASVLLEQMSERLTAAQRIWAHQRLFETTGREQHQHAAERAYAFMREHTNPALRSSLARRYGMSDDIVGPGLST